MHLIGIICHLRTRLITKIVMTASLHRCYKATQLTCLVSIGTEQKDLIQLQRAASMFWFKDRSGLSIALVLGQIVTDCNNTHDEVLLLYLENNARDQYYRSIPPTIVVSNRYHS